ncbi:hypothetical protein ACL9RL_05410 [Plantibacter sp. Mn2098]|uniref:hypothetical protein n=1 Tax=Plantibacter sp. Mn2098 TaxID=3395266 RepID=UPI003BE127F0
MSLGTGSLRRGIALGIAVTGLVVVVGGAVYAGLGGGAVFAERQDESDRLAQTLETAKANLPSVAPVVPTDVDGVDFSRTPAGWYDARTDPASIVIPQTTFPTPEIWSTQQQLTAVCMAKQGFWYAWTFNAGDGLGGIQSDAAFGADGRPNAAKVALDGDWVGTYRWQDAGCQGASVHQTGMDDAH